MAVMAMSVVMLVAMLMVVIVVMVMVMAVALMIVMRLSVQAAFVLGSSLFRLQRRVMDAELFFQSARNLIDHRIARIAGRHHQVAGQRHIGRAH